MSDIQNDHIYLSTRIVAALVVPFLILAFIILFFTPESSGERFAWEIKPEMTAVFMGAGYLGGSWLFINVTLGSKWHRVSAGFLPVTAFTISMLLATIVHRDRFSFNHFPFLLWLALYLVTPVLVPLLWLRNRSTDPKTAEPEDIALPSVAPWILGALGWFLLFFSLVSFLSPAWMTAIWPWQLSPLTARILSGWFSLLGVGGIVIARDTRWSAWQVGLQSIGLWHVLVLAGAWMHRADFTAGLFNWYLLSVTAVVIGMAVLYAYMERRRATQRSSKAVSDVSTAP